MIIGVTGPSGAGKSEVCRIAAKKFGIKVIDCDLYARKAVCDEMITELCARFGKGILKKDGTLDRKALAAVAFDSKEATADLNRITHPYIITLVRADIKKEKNVILDAPTLYESGMDRECDAVVAVLADRNIRGDRLLMRDVLTDFELADRMKAAKPDEFYTAKTDKLIINDGSPKKLEAATVKMFSELLGGNVND